LNYVVPFERLYEHDINLDINILNAIGSKEDKLQEMIECLYFLCTKDLSNVLSTAFCETVRIFFSAKILALGHKTLPIYAKIGS
jgi:hypothetical protein